MYVCLVHMQTCHLTVLRSLLMEVAVIISYAKLMYELILSSLQLLRFEFCSFTVYLKVSIFSFSVLIMLVE